MKNKFIYKTKNSRIELTRNERVIMKILLVEDDARLGAATAELLEFEGCAADWAHDGREALQYFNSAHLNSYDVVMLDWMIPELNGIEVCKILRRKYNFQGGIIFVTAKGEEEDCINALAAGADDFVVKPYRIKELMARLRAVCRRKSKPFVDKVLVQNAVAIDRNLNMISSGGQSLVLRRKEFALFELLFINLNNILPREAIFEKVWADKLETGQESLDSHIYSLRKKLKSFLPQIKIKLVKNIGYVMEMEK